MTEDRKRQRTSRRRKEKGRQRYRGSMRKVAAVQKEINDQHGKNREGNRDIQGALERERVAATFEQKEDQREANRKKGTSKEKNQCRNQKEQENPQEKKREKEKRRIWILTKTDHDKCGGNVGGDRGPAGDEVVLGPRHHVPQVALHQHSQPRPLNTIQSSKVRN